MEPLCDQGAVALTRLMAERLGVHCASTLKFSSLVPSAASLSMRGVAAPPIARQRTRVPGIEAGEGRPIPCSQPFVLVSIIPLALSAASQLR